MSGNLESFISGEACGILAMLASTLRHSTPKSSVDIEGKTSGLLLSILDISVLTSVLPT